VCNVEALMEYRARLPVPETQAMETSRQEILLQAGRMACFSSADEAAYEAHALLNLNELAGISRTESPPHEFMEVSVIFDGCNLLDPEAECSAGL